MPDSSLPEGVPAARWTVVLDDDPTGTQGLANVPVVIRPNADTFAWAIAQGPVTYVLTNTRALAADAAAELLRDTVVQAEAAARTAGVTIRYVSRGDSTLRGHFPLEVQTVLQHSEGTQFVGCLLVPAFPDAGRLTLDGVHYVEVAGVLTPVAESEYAGDATFGFSDSYLVDWARARVPAAWLVEPISSSVFDEGVEALARVLSAQEPFTVVCPSIRGHDDLDLLGQAQRLVEESYGAYIVQAGPSYPRHLAGISTEPVTDIRFSGPHGLIVVGSHTGTTTGQLLAATAEHSLRTVEMGVPAVLGDAAGEELHRCVVAVGDNFRNETVVIATSRERIAGTDSASSLLIANRIAAALTEVAHRAMQGDPAFVIAKGGITSRDIVADALKWDAALVLGPLIDKTLPVWEAWDATPGDVRCIIFPGNVGEVNLLSRALTRLEALTAAPHGTR